MATTTLIDNLISPIDVVRKNLHTILGDRPYKVYTVKQKWDGGGRGLGNVTEVSRVLLDPPPLISQDTNLEAVEAGLDEVGTIKVTEISLALTEAALTGEPLAVDEEFFFEVQYDKGSTCRYKPVSRPERDVAGKFGYTIVLKRLSDA
jgi:hypothetical protein